MWIWIFQSGFGDLHRALQKLDVKTQIQQEGPNGLARAVWAKIGVRTRV